jgi:glycosyltransferase involved in cell wall biosynthesis
LLPATRDPRQAYWDSDAVLLASWYEGCPNVICEAMACGKPVLASAVSDNPLIVEDGVTGLLFDPRSPGDIAEAIEEFAAMSLERRHTMGVAGRRRAETFFDLDSCSRQYEELLASASLKRGASAIRC